ncbi:hypothetical protein ACF3MZ_19135 [Paenibacillaceae bacterium WGS1546]|uniref:hypothetical protein n=1 Tax=Cohnella sp. WGS1546 TaxID=3366810 RepID=UPI00372D865C
MSHAALMFQFPDEAQARLAAETLDELGYEPQLHEGDRLHIHVRNEDLTSALEIAQSCSGRLLDQAPTETIAATDAAYGIENIPIPAHTVNEDWVDDDRYAAPDMDEEPDSREGFATDDGSYDRFETT